MGELKRELGLKEVIATVVTTVIGGGLFLTTIQIQDKLPIGSSIIFSYMLAAIPAFMLAICYVVLTSALPSSGGEYVFVSRIIDPFLGFIVTWGRWFAMIGVIAAMSVGDVIIFTHLCKILHMEDVSFIIASNIQLIAIVLVLIFLIINYLGVRLYGKVQTAMFVLLMIGITLFIFFGLQHVNLSNIESSFTPDLGLILRASSLIFFSYIGFSAITDAGDEVKNAKKTLPRGILISIFVIAAIYILVALVTYGSMSPSFYASYNFANGSVAESSAVFLPFAIAAFVAFTGSIAIISDINPIILATSRLSYAWARDRIAPQKLAELNKYNVPHWTLLINGAMAIAIILLARQFMEAVMMVNMSVLLVYIAISISTLILPYKHPEIYKKAEFKLRGLWIFALGGLLLSSFFLVFILRFEGAMPGFILLLVWIALGSVLYVFNQERHRLYWRIQKQQRKEKEVADRDLVKGLMDEIEDKLVKKKK